MVKSRNCYIFVAANRDMLALTRFVNVAYCLIGRDFAWQKTSYNVYS